jgi:hypothetical protein
MLDPPLKFFSSYGLVSNTNSVDAANLFSKYFSSIYAFSPSSVSLSSNIQISQFILPSHPFFSLDDVSKSLCSLRNIKSIGPDGLQSHFLFMLSNVISWPLFFLFRKSIDSGVFSAAPKIGSITPLLKSDDSKFVSNYRSINLLSHLSKVFESIVLNSSSSQLYSCGCTVRFSARSFYHYL